MAVIDSCEIPAKHNYNNSAAADQRAESGPGHQLPGLTLLCSCIEVETSGGGRISVVFHLANSHNSRARFPARGEGRGVKAVISTRKFLAAEAMLSLLIGGR